MIKNKVIFFVVAIIVFTPFSPLFSDSSLFNKVHKESLIPDRQMVLKKILFVSGLTNGVYHGINDLVAALQLVKKTTSPEVLSAQLLAVKIGLIEKPALIRHIASEIRQCEDYPEFPLGFPDSPEGPEKISEEFFKIADHIENLKINFQSDDLAFLKKEAQRVVFELFWTDSEKMRTMAMDMLSFLRLKLKEEIPFDIFGKKIVLEID